MWGEDGSNTCGFMPAWVGHQLHEGRLNPYPAGSCHCDSVPRIDSMTTTIMVVRNENREAKREGVGVLVEPDELSRFEGEGGLEALEPAMTRPQKLIDPALGDPIRQRPPYAAHRTNRNHGPKEMTT